MGELACMIAPRSLLIVAGRKDDIFPIEGSREVYKVIEDIYRRENAEGKCHYVETDREHWFCKDLVWENIVKIINTDLKW